MKKIIAALILLTSVVWLDRVCHRKPKFINTLIYATPPFSAKWQPPSLTPEEQQEIDTILSQPFSYLDKGSQAYVFESEDKRYVLKFLKQHIYTPNSWACYIPFSFNPYYNKYCNRKKKKQAAYEACQIAYTYLKEKTGLIYVHLNPTDHLKKTLTLVSRKGHPKSIEIDKACFLIQKKADLIYPRISQLMEGNHIDQAEKVISSVFSLIDCFFRLGIYDNDAKVWNNFGLIDDNAIQIDVGIMKIDPLRALKPADPQEKQQIAAPLGLWLEENHPELLAHFNKLLNPSQL
ncbi:MAG: hypothetical protein K2P51_06770 [Rhabdochlamydiaceae bacterium]|nr:hypothetical protein [Rhabdochlamydiaceae bacterium]